MEKKKNKIIFKDPVSGFSHLIGAIAAIPITIFLVKASLEKNSMIHLFSFLIFGISMFSLYLASTIYHLANVDEKTEKILRTIDHMMIFVLIAGTYTPMCLIVLHGRTGNILITLVWLVAIIGIVIKAFWMNAPRWLSTLIYIGMGWLAIFAIIPLYNALPTGGMVLLVLGGLIYTLGALIYNFKWPHITNEYFGFHELFHIFILLGSLSHVLLMIYYVLPMNIK